MNLADQLRINNPDRERTDLIWRKVVESITTPVYGHHYNAYRRKETFEHCGHVKYFKGSEKPAEKRRCKECEGFRRGVIQTSGTQFTFWDSELQRPFTMEMG